MHEKTESMFQNIDDDEEFESCMEEVARQEKKLEEEGEAVIKEVATTVTDKTLKQTDKDEENPKKKEAPKKVIQSEEFWNKRSNQVNEQLEATINGDALNLLFEDKPEWRQSLTKKLTKEEIKNSENNILKRWPSFKTKTAPAITTATSSQSLKEDGPKTELKKETSGEINMPVQTVKRKPKPWEINRK